MSVTVSAVPYLLISGLSGVIQMSAELVSALGTKSSKIYLEQEEVKQLLSQEFDTNIVDRDVLLKTLTEHGAENIETGVDGSISCDCEIFHVEFKKYVSENPYKMSITYNENANVKEFVENIGSEYASNAQEVSYMKIKERLTEQNLEINEEEVYDDNTIVLTVNLE